MAQLKPRYHRPEYVHTHRLPPQLRMLVRAMGEAPAFRLVEHRGGTVLAVPKECSAEHWLFELVGPAAFAALVEAKGGETMELPKFDSVVRQYRHLRVRELLRWRTVNEVALEMNYSRRHVINISNAEKQERSMQGDLFASIGDEADAEADAATTEAGAHDPFGLTGRR